MRRGDESKASRDLEAEVEAIEDALGLRGRSDPGSGAARQSAEPSTAEGWRLATELAALADAVPPVEPSPELRRRVLASVRPDDRFAGLRDRLRALTDLSAARVEELLGAASDPSGPGWRDGPAPGIRWHLFEAGPARGGGPGALVYCEPGVRFPPHRHTGTEWALVLEGGAADSSGDRWSLGDTIEYRPGTSHSFTTGDGPLLAVVVSERAPEWVDR